MDIPGLSTLYAIHKRTIDRENDVLRQRKDLSLELKTNCHRWSELLVSTFRDASNRWATEGRHAAVREILELEQDFLRLDYCSLESDSPIIAFLREDSSFRPFADACVSFYQSALSLKRMARGDLMTVSAIQEAEREWRTEVERMLREVDHEHQKVRILVPR
jgi:hypothetical protein